MEKIQFVERVSDNCVFIGVYNNICNQYGKHTLLRREDGGFLWEFTYMKNIMAGTLDYTHDIIPDTNRITEFKDGKQVRKLYFSKDHLRLEAFFLVEPFFDGFLVDAAFFFFPPAWVE